MSAQMKPAALVMQTLDTHELSELESCPAHLGELRDKPLDVALGEHERAGRVLVRAMRRAS